MSTLQNLEVLKGGQTAHVHVQMCVGAHVRRVCVCVSL